MQQPQSTHQQHAFPEDGVFHIVVGNAKPVSVRLSPVPSLNTSDASAEYMVYFNLNDTRFVSVLQEFARLVHERYNKRKPIFLCPESSPIALAFALRVLGHDVQLISKKQRVGAVHFLKESYSAMTSTTTNALYFDGFDEGINTVGGREAVLLDNVVTTGGTFRACYRLIKRFDPNIKIIECCVLYTEGDVPFHEIEMEPAVVVPIVALSGHLPVFRKDQVAPAVAIASPPPPQFTFKSSARFPSYYCENGGKILFCVFEDVHEHPAVCVIGPRTFGESKSAAHLAPKNVADHSLWNDVPLRVHDACLTSECFHSCKCDCREQLEVAMREIGRNGGMLIYLAQEGRGIGLANKIKAYFLQEAELHDTVSANRALGLPDDARSYVAVRDILKHFRVGSVKLMTNNPRKIDQLQKLGVVVSSRIEIAIVAQSKETAKYLHDKANAMGHVIPEKCFSNANIHLGDELRVIRFYEPNDDFGFLSNFYPSPITIEGRTYPTVEHYYQSRKFVHAPDIWQRIVSAPSPDEAFRLSREFASQCRADWEVHKKRDMFRGLVFKFKQNADLQKLLLQTGDRYLVENSQVDAFWGCGADGKGENVLGRMLVNIREFLIDNVHDPQNPLN